MLTRFFSAAEIIRYFERGTLSADLNSGEIIAICSIADLLDICEAYKKDNLNISHVELHTRFEEFKEHPVKEGSIYIVDLDQDKLSSSLFERDNGAVVDFWHTGVNRSISPKRSVRYLTIRIIDDSTWWSEQVYQEMEEYHISQDG